MNLDSPLFDSIRVKRSKTKVAPKKLSEPPCEHPSCNKAGIYRAPKGRNRDKEFFCFCLDHVREYNQTYNYFKDMSDEDVAQYQKEAIVGHRPTWNMGVKKAGGSFNEQAGGDGFVDPFGMFGGRRRAEPLKKSRSRIGVAQKKALATLGLEESADAPTIRARYKELVKRFHPDANGGDRSREQKLREIIQAYKQLRTAKLA